MDTEQNGLNANTGIQLEGSEDNPLNTSRRLLGLFMPQ
jgi:hypothetical protein